MTETRKRKTTNDGTVPSPPVAMFLNCMSIASAQVGGPKAYDATAAVALAKLCALEDGTWAALFEDPGRRDQAATGAALITAAVAGLPTDLGAAVVGLLAELQAKSPRAVDEIAMRIGDTPEQIEDGLTDRERLGRYASRSGIAAKAWAWLTGSDDGAGSVRLGDALAGVGRGGPFRARDLDVAGGSEGAIHRLCELRNIQMEDGAIARTAPLASLDGVKGDPSRHTAFPGDVVISKVASNYGSLFRSAVVRPWDGEALLCSGNLYILRVDKGRMDPDWLQMWLESPDGQSSLQAMASPGRLPMLRIGDLQDLRVPAPAIEEQREVGDRRRGVAKAMFEAHRDLDDLRRGFGNFE